MKPTSAEALLDAHDAVQSTSAEKGHADITLIEPLPVSQVERLNLGRECLTQSLLMLHNLVGNSLLVHFLAQAMRRVQQLYGYNLSKDEQRLFNWHVANLEYGCATDLNNLSLAYWYGSCVVVVGLHQVTGPLLSQGSRRLIRLQRRPHHAARRLREPCGRAGAQRTARHSHEHGTMSGAR